jgi:hypothetical protein
MPAHNADRLQVVLLELQMSYSGRCLPQARTMRQSLQRRKRQHKIGELPSGKRRQFAQKSSSPCFHIRIGTNFGIGRCSDMTEWTARQLLSLWPVLLGSVALGVLIAFATGT